jgi:hypothetical protein
MRVRIIDMAVVLAIAASLAACTASQPPAQNAASRGNSDVAQAPESCPITDGFGPDDIPDYGQWRQWSGNPC